MATLDRPQPRTVCPNPTNSPTIARPRPRVTPVMRTILPAIRPSTPMRLRQPRSGPEVGVDSGSGTAAITHGMQHKAGTAHDVPAGKHAGDAGHLVAIHDEPAPIVNGELAEIVRAGAWQRIETQSRDDPISLQTPIPCRPWMRNGLGPLESARPTSVRTNRKPATPPRSLASTATGAARNRNRAPSSTAFSYSPPAARHIGLVAPIDTSDLARSATDGSAQAIHGGVASAEHGYARAGDLKPQEVPAARASICEG